MSIDILLRQLPAVGRLLGDPLFEDAIELYGRDAVRVQARIEIAALRNSLAQLEDPKLAELRLQTLPVKILDGLRQRLGTPLQSVINATGVFLHTNLGRAPLPSSVIAEVSSLLGGYCDLEMDLESGKRSDRNRRISPLLEALCGAEKSIVTNNNAGALILILATFAAGRQVVVSRGELVEIGGSFRIPDILEASGAQLVEVGTTNRTRLEDYRRAINPHTAVLLKVHPSNYRIRGFTESVEPAELTALGQERGVAVVFDEGSGLLQPDDDRAPLRDHHSMQQLLEAGADVVCGSGDKLLGGPQAGLLCGRATWVERCRKNPLYRALRPDRFCYAALEAVLRRRLADGGMPMDRLWPDPRAHQERVSHFASRVGGEVSMGEAFLGGGSAPDESIPGQIVSMAGSDRLLTALRQAGRDATGDLPAVVAYLREGRLHLDLRTVDPADDDLLVRAVQHAHQLTTANHPADE